MWLALALGMVPLIQGCDQKVKAAPQQQTLAPPIVDAPPPKPSTVSTADLPPPVVGNPEPPPGADTVDNSTPAKKPVRHTKKPATASSQPVQEASNGTAPPTPSVSAVGSFSSGASGDSRSQTEEAINSTEKGLNSITRPLNDSENKTAAQIREFLKQARAALASGDVDGASTLIKRAKVLLAELNQ
jgi:hypothetical protein